MRRIYLSVLFTVVFSFIGIGWVLDYIAQKTYQAELPSTLQMYEKIALASARQLSEAPSHELDAKLASLIEDFSVSMSLEPEVNLALPEQLLAELNQVGFITLQSSDGALIFAYLTEHPDFFLQMTIEQLVPEAEHLDVALTFSLYVGVGLCLALWLVPLTRRLSLLTKTAAAFGAGKLNKRIELGRFSYVQDLEHSFNRMADQIETLVHDNKLLAQSLSHDLRTPVACLRFGVEAAQESASQEKTQEYLVRVEQELTRLETMLDAFLSYASMERKAQELVLQHINVAELLTGCMNEVQPIAHHHHIHLDYDVEPSSIFVSADGHWLHRALMNLLTNAITHAKGKVILEAFEDEGQAIIAIHDDGQGVPHEQRDAIFSPFVTVESSRNRQKNSYGLGLAIVQRIVHWHQGKVWVDDSKRLSGASFSLSMPNNPQ